MRIGSKVLVIKEDLPLPDTPVTHVNVPNGIATLTFFKLWPFAPFSSIKEPFPLRRFLGISIHLTPLK